MQHNVHIILRDFKFSTKKFQTKLFQNFIRNCSINFRSLASTNRLLLLFNNRPYSLGHLPSIHNKLPTRLHNEMVSTLRKILFPFLYCFCGSTWKCSWILFTIYLRSFRITFFGSRYFHLSESFNCHFL